MNEDIDAHVFKEFLQYDLSSGSLWEIVDIFERHRADFKKQVKQYQEEISLAQKELGTLREQISLAKKERDAISKPKKSLFSRNKNTPKNSTHTHIESIPKDYKQRILELELENKRLKIELRDIKQEIELKERDNPASKPNSKK